MTIDISKLKILVSSKFPRVQNSEYFERVLSTLPEQGFNTVNRLAMFLAQCAHESANFTVLKENLNYSAQALLRVFPKYFSSATVNSYARNPEKIANKVYAGRMGNNQVGDGWKYRGRGYIQLTGKNNYKAFSEYLKSINRTDILDPLENPDELSKTLGAMQSAVWFWNMHNLNTYADADNITGCTKVINGGYNGLKERTSLYTSLKAQIKELRIFS